LHTQNCRAIFIGDFFFNTPRLDWERGLSLAGTLIQNLRDMRFTPQRVLLVLAHWQ